MKNFNNIARIGLFGFNLLKLYKYGFPISERMYAFYSDICIHKMPAWVWNRSFEQEIYLQKNDKRISSEKRNIIREYIRKNKINKEF